MGLIDWLKGKREKKKVEREEIKLISKAKSAERKQVETWVQSINSRIGLVNENLKTLRKELAEANIPAEEVARIIAKKLPKVEGIPELLGRIKDIQAHTSRIPAIQEDLKLLETINNNISELRQLTKKIPKKVRPKHLEPITKEFISRLDVMEGMILPKRIEVLLSDGKPRTFKQLKEELNTTDPTLSKHLKRMKDRLLKRPVGRQVFYSLKPILKKESLK